MSREPQSLRAQSPHKHQEKESLPLLGLPTPEQRATTVLPRGLTVGRRVTAHALTLGGAIADAALTAQCTIGTAYGGPYAVTLDQGQARRDQCSERCGYLAYGGGGFG